MITVVLRMVVFSIVMAISLSGCLHSNEYEATYKVHNCNSLYANVYKVKWMGIYSDNSSAIYLTDSLNFKIYLGIYGEDDSYGCKINGDTLIIENGTRGYAEMPVVTKIRRYGLSKLKKEHKYE